VLEHSESLLENFQKAQSEIADTRSLKGAQWPRDINLVLISSIKNNSLDMIARSIIDDRQICRKFVISVNGTGLREELKNLPFWPIMDELRSSSDSLISGVQGVLEGYDPTLLSDLAHHKPSVARVFSKIQEGKYSLYKSTQVDKKPPVVKPITTLLSKISALEITDFRGINHLSHKDIPLDGDIVFIYGPNGVGKTSIAEALEWAITGQVQRLEERPQFSKEGPDPIVNIFSQKHEAKVTCYFLNRDQITRIKSGSSTCRQIGTRSVTEDRTIIDHVVGTRAPSPESQLGVNRLRELFRGSHMLSQHDIRSFLEVTKPSERFDILTNMIGAEEFVRFRNKTSAVSSHISSFLNSNKEKQEALLTEIKDISTKLNTRQIEMQQISSNISNGKTSEILLKEILEGLKSCNCSIDEQTFKQENSTSDYVRIATVSLQIKKAISQRKSQIDSALINLDSIIQESANYFNAKAKHTNLLTEILQTKAAIGVASGKFAEKELSTKNLRAQLNKQKLQQSQALHTYAALSWLKENLPDYNQYRKEIVELEQNISSIKVSLQELQPAIDGDKKVIAEQEIKIQNFEKEITNKNIKANEIAFLINETASILEKSQRLVASRDSKNNIANSISKLKEQISTIQKEIDPIQITFANLQKEYNVESVHLNEVSSLLTKLSTSIDSPECPLCGQHFLTVDKAKEVISSHLDFIPNRLKEKAYQLEKAKKIYTEKLAQTQSLSDEMSKLLSTHDQLNSEIIKIEEIVSNFALRCARLGLSISKTKLNEWKTILENAKVECKTDALILELNKAKESSLKLNTQIIQRESTKNSLNEKLVQEEKLRRQRLNNLQEMEATMKGKGIQVDKLPTKEELNGQLASSDRNNTLNTSMLNQMINSLTQSEEELASLSKTIVNMENEVANKESQRPHYESICSHFTNACIANNINYEKPSESAAAAKIKLVETQQMLVGLDKKASALEQIGALDKIKEEINNLATMHQNIKAQLDGIIKESNEMQKWQATIGKLEKDVVANQIDVVSSHLKRLEPTTQLIYKRLNSHPVFGKVKISVDEKTRELEVQAEMTLSQTTFNKLTVQPSAFFSDAQLNTMAITVFLGGALRQCWSGLDTVVFDDPIQQMDEMNVTAFIDLLRGLSKLKQFIVFTCNQDFYLLAIEKLSCLNNINKKTFLAYRLEGITPAQLQISCDAS
jgi:DNA repair exonuclease SbcCD ATPase subunit